MIVKYNSEKLGRIIEDIAVLTGISISILDTEYNAITSSSERQKFCSLLQATETEQNYCKECDEKILSRCALSKKLEGHICRSGLYDCAMPIIKYDTIIAFVIMGQVRSAGSPSTLNYLPDASSHITKDLNLLYSQTPFLTRKQLSALYDLLPHILFNDAIEIVYDPLVNEITEFIEANLSRKIAIGELCQKFHVSKNYLYEAFRNNLGNTVIGYINEQRIRRAKELLEQTTDSVYEISEKVGVNNYTYFCKLFKKICKTTPADYRKNLRKHPK